MTMWRALVMVVMVSACGTQPADVSVIEGTNDAGTDAPAAEAPTVVYLPDDTPKPAGMEALPLVEVHGRVGLGQCSPCVTEFGHGCCGTDGWTAPVACGNAQGYLMGCGQREDSPTGCGQDVVAGLRVCE